MKTADAVAHFGSQHKLAKALGMTQATVCRWGEFPPVWRQLQIETMTDARLKAESDCDKFRAPLRTVAA